MTTTRRTKLRKCLPPVLLAAFGLWLLAGCVYLPTFNSRVSGTDVSGEVGKPDSKRPLRINDARREDVLRVLGPPWAESEDGRQVAYTWVVRNGVWVWPLCFQGYPQLETRTLTLTFDDNDVLASYELSQLAQNFLTSGPHAPYPKVPTGVRMRKLATRPSTLPATRTARPMKADLRAQ
jgi:hypothetical protein